MKEHRNTCDVVVIGGGPAGNIAARALSKAGLRVIVLDSRHDIGNKPCTGIIGMECATRFPVDPSLVYGSVKGATVRAPDGSDHVLGNDEIRALIIDRVSYIANIASEAGHLGARYILGSRVHSVSRLGDLVEIATRCGSGTEVFMCRVAIISNGFGSNLLSAVGLNKTNRRDYMVASQIEVEVEEIDEIKLYTGNHVAPGSFAWLVPTHDSLALLGAVSRDRLNDKFDKLILMLKREKVIRKTHGTVTKWGIPLKALPKTYSRGVLVAGDAGGFAKPTTGGGIYYAMLSGDMAAQTVIKAFESGDFSESNLSKYESMWRNKFGRELQTGYLARLLFESLDDESLNVLIRCFSSESVQSAILSDPSFSFDRHGSIILETFKHKDILNAVRSLGVTGGGRIIPRLLKTAASELVSP